MRVLVYLGRTRSLGITYSRSAERPELHAYADSNWSTTRSITGFVIFLGGAYVHAAARRQHCISMSSCEAELIALADLSIEIIYFRALLKFLGYDVSDPTEVSTDNKGAYDLCHRYTSAANSRHVDRKLFKMREMCGTGDVTVKRVGTEWNPADLYTKILSRQPFEKFRKWVLNSRADTAAQLAHRQSRVKGGHA